MGNPVKPVNAVKERLIIMKSIMKNTTFVISISMNIGEFGCSECSEHQYSSDDNSHRDMGKHGKDIIANAEIKFGVEELESETAPVEVKELFDFLKDALHKEVRHQVEEQLEPVPQEEEDENVEVSEPPIIISDDDEL